MNIQHKVSIHFQKTKFQFVCEKEELGVFFDLYVSMGMVTILRAMLGGGIAVILNCSPPLKPTTGGETLPISVPQYVESMISRTSTWCNVGPSPNPHPSHPDPTPQTHQQ